MYLMYLPTKGKLKTVLVKNWYYLQNNWADLCSGHILRIDDSAWLNNWTFGYYKAEQDDRDTGKTY